MTNQQGDVIKILDYLGVDVATYHYNAWGECEAEAIYPIVAENPLRYRGYVYDHETGLYYLQSRYYDPEIGRFINADGYVSTGQGILGNNMFAYCGNNPVVRLDSGGAAFETVFDVVSLAASIVEVAINPTDLWAWAGLVGDVIDLIPFVTGVGEVTRAVKTFNQLDDVVDSAKAMKQSVNSAVGAYEVLYESGKNYVGKGTFGRAIQSAIEHAKPNEMNEHMGDVVTSIRWKASYNNKMAFMEEYALQTIRGVNNVSTYNKIWSPGRRYWRMKDF